MAAGVPRASAGWVSFEPTPQEPRGEVAPEGVVGPSGVNSTVPTAPANTPTTAPSPSAPLTVPTTVPVPSGSNNSTSSNAAVPSSASELGPVGWTLIAAGAVFVVGLVVLFVRRRRRWSPVGRSPEQLALLAHAEVGRALRRGGVERPRWQPMDLFFEDLTLDNADRSEQATATATSVIADGITVAHTADAALFDPFGTSEERSCAAYEAALRVRRELKSATPSSMHG